MMNATKTILVGSNTVTFELPALRGAKALAAAERRASLLHEYVMTWNFSNAHLADMARSDLQCALDERTSAAFWTKATMETMRALRVEGASLHI